MAKKPTSGHRSKEQQAVDAVGGMFDAIERRFELLEGTVAALLDHAGTRRYVVDRMAADPDSSLMETFRGLDRRILNLQLEGLERQLPLIAEHNSAEFAKGYGGAVDRLRLIERSAKNDPS